MRSSKPRLLVENDSSATIMAGHPQETNTYKPTDRHRFSVIELKPPRSLLLPAKAKYY